MTPPTSSSDSASSPSTTYHIGVDGGGTKTECILVDGHGEIVARHLAPGCNPSIAGPERAREILLDALHALIAISPLTLGLSPRPSRVLLCMAGAREFWQETATSFTAEKTFGTVTTTDDSIPVLELATDGRAGLVLHGGTGSFVAARDPSGEVHYAGGLGWRFGDEGSGFDLGRRAIARALLELQGWAPRTALADLVERHAQLADTAQDARAVTRHFYQHPEPNRVIAALAPGVLELAANGDAPAGHIVSDSCLALLALAERVAIHLFPVTSLAHLPAGLSGPILTHPFVQSLLRTHTGLPLTPIAHAPIEGVRRLLRRI